MLETTDLLLLLKKGSEVDEERIQLFLTQGFVLKVEARQNTNKQQGKGEQKKKKKKWRDKREEIGKQYDTRAQKRTNDATKKKR